MLYALDLLGTAAFAASSVWAGIRRDMDLFGAGSQENGITQVVVKVLSVRCG